MTLISQVGSIEHRCGCYRRVQDHPVCNGCGILVGKRHLEARATMKGVIVNEMAQENEWSDYKIIRTAPMRLMLCGHCVRESMVRTLNVSTRWVSERNVVKVEWEEEE